MLVLDWRAYWLLNFMKQQSENCIDNELKMVKKKPIYNVVNNLAHAIQGRISNIT